VHSSLRALGWVCGGPVAVVQALMDVVGEKGTVVVPTQTGGCSDPTHWSNPPVPSSWWATIKEQMPAFDPRITPSSQMGAIAETLRTWPGTLRSSHPQASFAAWGRHAEEIVADHALDYGLGEQSPLARIYDLDGHVLLLGVGYDNCTSFHLAEYRVPGSVPHMQGTPVLENRVRVWKTLKDIEIDSDIFPEIGVDFEREVQVSIGLVGSAQCRLFRQRSGVDFTQGWLTKRRIEHGEQG